MVSAHLRGNGARGEYCSRARGERPGAIVNAAKYAGYHGGGEGGQGGCVIGALGLKLI